MAIKRVQGFNSDLNKNITIDINTKNLILVTVKNNVTIYRTSKFYYIKLEFNRYSLLAGKNLKLAAEKYNFKVEQYQKNTRLIHGNLNELEYNKLENFKAIHNINTNQAIKKLIATI